MDRKMKVPQIGRPEDIDKTGCGGGPHCKVSEPVTKSEEES